MFPGQKDEVDLHSLAADPLFTGPVNGDFSLRPNHLPPITSPLLAVTATKEHRRKVLFRPFNLRLIK